MPKETAKVKKEETALNEADKLLIDNFHSNRICHTGQYPDYPILEKLFLKKGKITKGDIRKLSYEEKTAFNYAVNDKIYSLWGKDKDFLLDKIENVISEESKLNRWNIEHIDIKVAISEFVKDCNRMPSIHELTGRTGLSQKTIRKHLLEFESHQNHTEQQQLNKILGEKILAKVAKSAIEGDVKAARLYLEVINGGMNRPPIHNNTFNTQNNLLQINGKMVSQQDILSLPPDQQLQLAAILQHVPQPKNMIKIA